MQHHNSFLFILDFHSASAPSTEALELSHIWLGPLTSKDISTAYSSLVQTSYVFIVWSNIICISAYQGEKKSLVGVFIVQRPFSVSQNFMHFDTNQ